jgi:hypothetical protein
MLFWQESPSLNCSKRCERFIGGVTVVGDIIRQALDRAAQRLA